MSGARQAAGDDLFEVAIREAQAEIARSVDKCGLRGDPIRFPLAALSSVVGLFPDFMRQMRETVQETRQPLDGAALERMEKAAAKGASRAAAGLVRAHTWRSVLLGSLTISAAVAGGIGGGYLWGRSEATAQFRVAEAGFAAMVHDDPIAAKGWLAFAQMNDYRSIMAACRGDRGFADKSGRRACFAPLWIEDEKVDQLPKRENSSGQGT